MIHLTDNASKLIVTSTTDVKLDVEVVHRLIEMKRRWLPLRLGEHLCDANALSSTHVNHDLMMILAE